MTQLKSSSPSEAVASLEEDLGSEVLQESMKVEYQSSGLMGNFVRQIQNRSAEIFYSIIGHYGYKPKNEFSINQKIKILDYLGAKVLTDNTRLKEMEKVRFIDFDEKYLDNLPKTVEGMRNRILKGRTNVESAEQSLQMVRYSREEMTIKYLNEQAFEFDKTKFNSMAWGFMIGAFINCTLYKRGNPIRKIAFFLTFGHFFGVYSYLKNIDRYFDSVYPVFQRDAKSFTDEEKEIFKNWAPEGKGTLEE